MLNLLYIKNINNTILNVLHFKKSYNIFIQKNTFLHKLYIIYNTHEILFFFNTFPGLIPVVLLLSITTTPFIKT